MKISRLLLYHILPILLTASLATAEEYPQGSINTSPQILEKSLTIKQEPLRLYDFETQQNSAPAIKIRQEEGQIYRIEGRQDHTSTGTINQEQKKLYYVNPNGDCYEFADAIKNHLQQKNSPRTLGTHIITPYCPYIHISATGNLAPVKIAEQGYNGMDPLLIGQAFFEEWKELLDIKNAGEELRIYAETSESKGNGTTGLSHGITAGGCVIPNRKDTVVSRLRYQRYVEGIRLDEWSVEIDIKNYTELYNLNAFVGKIPTGLYEAARGEQPVAENDARKTVTEKLWDMGLSINDYQTNFEKIATLSEPYIMWNAVLTDESGKKMRFIINAFSGNIIDKATSRPSSP